MEIIKGFAGSLISIIAAVVIGPVHASGPFGRSPSPVISPCTNNKFFPGIGSTSWAGIAPNGGLMVNCPIGFGFEMSLISRITTAGP